LKEKLKEHENKKRKKQANLGKSRRPKLISRTCNPWNPRSILNQEAQFLTNLMLNDKIEKKYKFKKFVKVKKNRNKKIRIKFDRKKTEGGWNHKKKNLKIISNKIYINKKWRPNMIDKKKLEDEIEKKIQFYKFFQIKQIVNKRTWTKFEWKNKFKGCFEKLKG